MHDKVTALVTGVGGGGQGEQIVKALRLGKLRYHIVGTDITDMSSGRAMVDEFHALPRALDPGYLDAVLDLARKRGAQALFFGSEVEMQTFSRNCHLFEGAGLLAPINPSWVLDVCMDKNKTFEFLASRGIPIPRSKTVSSLEDIQDFDLFPAVLKPSVGGGGSVNTFIVQNSRELTVFGTYLLSLYPEVILQEYIGTPDAEYTVGVLFGGDGALLNSIAVKRHISNALSVRTRIPNQTARADLGPTLVISSGCSQGQVGRFPEVTEACERIAAALNPTAPVNIQCRVVDGRVMPFEINPRFSGTTSLRAMAGYNEPDVLIRRDLFGEVIEPHFSYRAMTIMRGLCEWEVPA